MIYALVSVRIYVCGSVCVCANNLIKQMETSTGINHEQQQQAAGNMLLSNMLYSLYTTLFCGLGVGEWVEGVDREKKNSKNNVN